ncbi:similar to Saccharomyces cerevisiae YMR252C Putative protein of unknown function [Maudiozyma barnettii]|uniref:Uncharacterized protein n=1 Tax=Maudiozyma barnettii TaxID=61262 RepID=A0A8H2ZFT4_9SACH|nr:Mlo1p [Kazachstania barnettii]CAB4252649.1 similar to Saccharomyces cerevisiae YMR252C Putative protein of unknown function [Kazachstania barnettii]CAD1780121.1 similar to Saccharomyces cerevisiae YMR252C Putative protein of unknown function [Kazachstania barnettii]
MSISVRTLLKTTRLVVPSGMKLCSFNNISIRYNSTETKSYYKSWAELELPERQQFIKEFVKNYKKQFPKSKTNLSLKMLSLDMDKFEDSPAVFGIFYNDIYKELAREAGQSIIAQSVAAREENRFIHSTFKRLLIRKPSNIP